MGIKDSLIMQEVNEISVSGEQSTNVRLECQIFNGTDWVSPLTVLGKQLHRDYEKDFGDILLLQVQVGLGTYLKKILPFREKLQVDLTTVPITEGQGRDIVGEKIKVKRYWAILLNQDASLMDPRTAEASSTEVLDRQGIVTVEFQLSDEAIQQIRMTTVGLIARQTTTTNLLTTILTKTTEVVDSKNQQLIFGVDVAPGFSTRQRSQIIIPPQNLTDVVAHLQDHEGGIYSTGASCYLQNGQWYLFSPYNTQVVGNTGKTLTVVMVPSTTYQGEKTYRKTGDNIVILCNGHVGEEDVGLASRTETGTGYRFINADRLLDGFVSPSDNKAVFNRNKNLTEFSLSDFSDGTSNVRWSDSPVSSNPFKHYTELARKSGRPVNLLWQHGDVDLLHPGMPVKLYALVNEQVKLFKGILLMASETRNAVDNGAIKSRYPASVRLGIFLERKGDNA